MKRALSIIGALISILYIYLSNFTIPGIITSAIIAVLLLLFLNLKDKRIFLLPALYVIVILSSVLTGENRSIVKALSDTFFLLPLIPLTTQERKTEKTLIIIILSLLYYVSLRYTEDNYYYIYYRIGTYGEFVTLFSILLLFSSLSALCLTHRREKNYLSLFLTLSSMLTSYILNRGYTFILPFTLYSSLILLIYIEGTKSVKIKTEKKKIVFSNLVPVEIEHLKKKEKKRIYEIPPNLPVDDRDGDIQ